MPDVILSLIQNLYQEPFLQNAETLLSAFRSVGGYRETILGRRNQLSALEANSKPALSVKERMLNAWEGSIKAASDILGIAPQNPWESMKIFNPNPEQGIAWTVPQGLDETFFVPQLVIRTEPNPERSIVNIASTKLVTVVVKDPGGMTLKTVKNGFLDLNSDQKMDDPGAWGKYGMGGSSSLSFCDYALVVTRHRSNPNAVLCTLIFVVHETDTDKQEFTRFWIADINGDPLQFDVKDFDVPFGTQIFHIGYQGKDWTDSAQISPKSPYRVFEEAFPSLPLPWHLHMPDAKTHDGKEAGFSRRTNDGIFYKLKKDVRDKKHPDEESIRSSTVPYIVDGQYLGDITIGGYVASQSRDPKGKRSSILTDSLKRIFYTHFGLTQAVDSNELLRQAGYFYMSDRAIIEVKLDHIKRIEKLISPNREGLKDGSAHATAVRNIVVGSLKQNPTLLSLEAEAAAAEVSKPIEIKGLFDNEQDGVEQEEIIQTPVVAPPKKKTTTQPPQRHGAGGHPRRDPIPVNHPPTFLTFAGKWKAVKLKPGIPSRIRFETDADRKKYTFANGGIRAEIGPLSSKVTIVKASLPPSGRGFIDVVYTGDPQIKRTILGDVVIYLAHDLDGKGSGEAIRKRQIFTKSKFAMVETKGKGVRPPEVQAKYYVIDKTKYPDGFPEFNIPAGDLHEMSESKFLRDPYIPAQLGLNPTEYPPMSERVNNTVHIEFNLSRTDLRKCDFIKYRDEVAFKACLDEVPQLSTFAESLRGMDELKQSNDGDHAGQIAKVRRAVKNHHQAKKVADAWKKANFSAKAGQ